MELKKNLKPKARKRGAQIDPTNRFEHTSRVDNFEDLEWDEALRQDSRLVKTEFIADKSQSIITENHSPDVGFQFSVNPYRGCEHGCTYCYARPTHETLGLNAGSDFESKILVKYDAPQLLRQALSKKKWRANVIAFSGVTDCYQPAERRFRLTQGCLSVLLEFGNPAIIISKNVLMLRDLAILRALAQQNLLHVYITITTLDAQLAAVMEPRTPPPAARLDAVRRLRAAGIPVGVMMAPVIPGLTDGEIPRLLEAVKAADAMCAKFVPLRLPLNVLPIFLHWLRDNFPLRAGKVEALIKDIRGGEYNDPNFNSRMRGSGAYALHIASVFRLFAKRFELDKKMPALSTQHFSIPHDLPAADLEKWFE